MIYLFALLLLLGAAVFWTSRPGLSRMRRAGFALVGIGAVSAFAMPWMFPPFVAIAAVGAVLLVVDRRAGRAPNAFDR